MKVAYTFDGAKESEPMMQTLGIRFLAKFYFLHEKFLAQRLFNLLLTVLFLFLIYSTCAPIFALSQNAASEGYHAVCADGNDFLAVGAGGRIDRIRPDSTIIHLRFSKAPCLKGIIAINGIKVGVGDKGTILFAKNGDSFQNADSGTKISLNGVTWFHNSFWVAGNRGILLHSEDGVQWSALQTGTKNDIISISANPQRCMAVTREGQILISMNGINWNILDYNRVYQGYDKPYWFHSIRACGNVFFLVGEFQEDSRLPILLSSDSGEVWRAYPLRELNKEPLEKYLPLTVNVVGMDWDQLLAACNGGKLLTITECSVCNKVTGLTGHNINDLAFANGLMAVVGDGFWFDILKNQTFRQYSIRPEQARIDQQKGALIVDVRSMEEYESSHIKGCIHIPVEQISTYLRTVITDKTATIIFYCAHGVRAQKALEEALLLGYQKVYNLGGIDDWPYEKESGVKGSFQVPEK
ncbi:MAG TPA: hypothetical protein DDW50_00885 [Firmicutes bacterium]|jgi:rhodanese-related sulfurtransferase|nr:hypothetical protein [Bacillota bacterium]